MKRRPHWDDQGRYTGGRRPHWDDDLLEHVAGMAYGELIRDDEWDSVRGWTYAVIAAVEDWQLRQAMVNISTYVMTVGRAEQAEATIQQMRKKHYPCCDPSVQCVMPPRQCRCGQAWPCDTIRILGLDGAE